MGWQLEVGSKRWDGKDERRPIADGWRLMSSYGQRLFLRTYRLTDVTTYRPRALAHPGSGAIVTGAATMGAEGNHPNWCLRRFDPCCCRQGKGAVVSDGSDDVQNAAACRIPRPRRSCGSDPDTRSAGHPATRVAAVHRLALSTSHAWREHGGTQRA